VCWFGEPRLPQALPGVACVLFGVHLMATP
jgi:hypothetical protein